MKLEKRAFVSFDEYCPFQCKHCFTYGIERGNPRSIDEIVNSLSDEEFDIIYVSQKNDNFAEPQRGIQLCNKLFEQYKCNLFIITRNVFTNEQIIELAKLKFRMEELGKDLFIAVSLNAIESIDVCEDTCRVPSPNQRMLFIEDLSKNGFKPILMLRPIFPNKMIPVTECLKIIDKTKNSISCVVSSALGINDKILQQLGLAATEFSYSSNQEYLLGAINCEIKFIDVDEELSQIQEKCESVNIPFFKHSLPAINYLIEQSE